jgi:hypothetical protein
MKKKIFVIAVAIALLVTSIMGSTVLAADPDTVTTSWSGSGHVDVTSNSGDTTSGVITEGEGIAGTYTVTDQNDNPYGYGVDTYSAVLTATVTNGFIDSGSQRLTSKESMYGDPGQISWSVVAVDGGSASMAYRTWTNYASLKDPGYTYQLAGGHNIVVDAEAYMIDRGLTASDGSTAYTYALGSGEATLDNMCSEASADGVRLGWGCGCYTDASFSATGTGTFNLVAVGEDEITMPHANAYGDLEPGAITVTGDGTPGGTTLNLLATWTSSFNIANYSVSVD